MLLYVCAHFADAKLRKISIRCSLTSHFFLLKNQNGLCGLTLYHSMWAESVPYYLHFIRIHLRRDFPDAVSYNRFVELESRVFFKMMFFLNLHSFERCTGITFVDSTMIPVCHNLRRYSNKVFAGLDIDGKGTGMVPRIQAALKSLPNICAYCEILLDSSQTATSVFDVLGVTQKGEAVR